MINLDKPTSTDNNSISPVTNTTTATTEIGNPYDYATGLLQIKVPAQVKEDLVLAGIERNKANEIVDTLVREKRQEIRENSGGGSDGTRDMVVGALWCIGGTIMTIADVGYIFWGAIVFGAVQFIGGAIKSRS